MTESEKYMTEALAEAEKALAAGEVPIGAVMVRNGEIIARGHNLRNTDKNPLRHAEIDVIDAAEKIVGDLFDYYLEYPEEMSGEFQALLDDGDPVRQVVCDYIACMTDRFAVAKYKTLFIPQEWTIL